MTRRSGGTVHSTWPAIVVAVLLAGLPSILPAQGVDSVTVEERVLMTPDLTPANARRRAIDSALAEAVRRVAGVVVTSTALSTTSESGERVHGDWRSVVQLDAAARAVDYRVLEERWESRSVPGQDSQLYLVVRLAALIQRESGAPDAAFRVELSLNGHEFLVRPGAIDRADEIVAEVRTSQRSHLVLVSIQGDSALRIFPNDYVSQVTVDAGVVHQLPESEWRSRGLRLRASLPRGLDSRRELLMVVATRHSLPPPPVAASVMEFQRWLVAVPLGDRALAVAPFTIKRAP